MRSLIVGQNEHYAFALAWCTPGVSHIELGFTRWIFGLNSVPSDGREMTDIYLVFPRFFPTVPMDRSHGPVGGIPPIPGKPNHDRKPLENPMYFPCLNQVKTRGIRVQMCDVAVSISFLIVSRHRRPGETQVKRRCFAAMPQKTLGFTRYLPGEYHLISIEFL